MTMDLLGKIELKLGMVKCFATSLHIIMYEKTTAIVNFHYLWHSLCQL